jgi:hypothetical protein
MRLQHRKPARARHHVGERLTVFDDHIGTGVMQAYTSTEFDAVLGQADHLAIFAVIDNVLMGGSFDLFVEQSADGRNFLQRNGAGAGAGFGDITIASIATGAASPFIKMYSDGCIGISSASSSFLPFVRFRIQLGGGGAHVAVHVTLRDYGR